MKNEMQWCLLAVAMMGMTALANEPGAEPVPSAAAHAPIGTQTRAWLALQSGGAQASATERSLPGEIADKTYQRYVKSFEQPIPESFAREGFSNSGGGSR